MRGSVIPYAAGIPVILDRRTLEQLEDGGALAIDIFLLREIRFLRSEYTRVGSPRVIYLAGSAIANLIGGLPGCQESFQYFRLHVLLAEMLVAHGGYVQALFAALDHLDLASEVARRITIVSDDILRAQVGLALLRAVARKALGDFDKAINGLRADASELANSRSASQLDLVPLFRQDVMMIQAVDGHRELAERAVRYARVEPREYYKSLKRVFEFALNRGHLDEAGRIYPELMRAFRVVSAGVPPISHISLLKNIGQFRMVEGDMALAGKILLQALNEAQQRSLHGQVRQIRNLLGELEAGNSRGKLITFAAEDLISAVEDVESTSAK